MSTIDFWLTAGSTYTYLSVNRIEDMAAQAGLRIRLSPFYLGRIFREDGFWPFHPDAARTAYMWRDIARLAQARGLRPKLPAPYACASPTKDTAWPRKENLHKAACQEGFRGRSLGK